MDSSTPHPLAMLRRRLGQHFSTDEVKTFVFDLGLDWDDLAGKTKSGKVRELLAVLAGRGRLSDLVDLLREEAPHVDWPDPPPPLAQAAAVLTDLSDVEREAALQKYLDSAGPILAGLDEREPEPAGLARLQAYTRAAVPRLDPQRAKILLDVLLSRPALARMVPLNGINLAGQALDELDLSRLVLVEANLAGASLRTADLSGIDCRQARLIQADLDGALLTGAILRAADLSGAKLFEADLGGLNLAEANLSGAQLQHAVLEGANLDRADLSRADLREARLARAFLLWADLSEADLTEADLREADLRNADLSDAILIEANFGEADLHDAILTGANCSLARFHGADLTRADVRGAVLEADLDDAILANVTADKTTRWPDDFQPPA